MPKQPIKLSLKEIGDCVENIERWCRFVKDAIASYDVGTQRTLMYAKDPEADLVPPRTGGNCPPPKEGSWESGGGTPTTGKKPKKPKKPRHPKKPKKPKNPKAKKKKKKKK